LDRHRTETAFGKIAIVADIVLSRRLRTSGLSTILAVVTLVVLVAMVSAFSTSLSGGAGLVAAIVAIFVPLLLLFTFVLSLRVEVFVLNSDRGRSLEIQYGFGIVKQRFAAEEILEATAKNLSFLEMGGWGYRGSLKVLRYAALATRRGEALELTLSRSRRFVVTVDNPEEFVQALGK